jgi:hypothetical protein
MSVFIASASARLVMEESGIMQPSIRQPSFPRLNAEAFPLLFVIIIAPNPNAKKKQTVEFEFISFMKNKKQLVNRQAAFTEVC